jgi:hypothetical protein
MSVVVNVGIPPSGCLALEGGCGVDWRYTYGLRFDNNENHQECVVSLVLARPGRSKNHVDMRLSGRIYCSP